MEENLEDLNNMGANEKKEKLQDVLSRIQNLNKDSIVSGKIEIVDISFYRTSENNYVYTILYNEKGPNNEIVERSKSYEEKQGEDGLILEEFDRNSIDDKIKENEEKIESYRALSYDVSELDKDLNDKNEKLKKDKEQLENPKESKNSLLNIERSENYIKDICQALGIKREDLEYYMSINGDESIFKDPEKLKKDFEKMGFIEADKKIDELSKEGFSKQESKDIISIDEKSNEAYIDANKLSKSSSMMQSGEIEGNKNITTNESLNTLLGQNFESYKIIKLKSGESFVLGVNGNKAEIINNNVLQVNDTKQVSLMKNDSTVRQARCNSFI